MIFHCAILTPMMKNKRLSQNRKQNPVLRRCNNLSKTVKIIYSKDDFIPICESTVIIDPDFDDCSYDDIKSIYIKCEK